MKLLQALSLVLILRRVHASLPYGLPDLDEDHLVPRDLQPPASNPSSTGIVPSGAPVSSLGTVFSTFLGTSTTSSTRVHPSSGTAPVLVSSLVIPSTATSSNSSSASSRPSLNSSSVVYASTINLTATSQLPTVAPTTGGIAPNSSSTTLSIGPQPSSFPSSAARSSASQSSQGLQSSQSSNSLSTSSTLAPSPSNFALPSSLTSATPTPSLVTTTITASNGAPSTVVITASQQPQTSNVGTMSSNQPSQASTAPASLPSGTSLEAIIGGIGYNLPSSDEDSIEVMLLDGSIAQLFAGKIIIGDQTVTLPSDLSSETTLPGGISAKPAEATTPDDNDDNDGGGGGVGGLFGALGGIAKGATSALGGAIGGVDAVTSGALAFAGGTAGAISGPLTGAIGDTGKFVSSLNGIQKSFPGNELTKGAFDTFTRAHQLARQSLNWMKSTQNLAQNFDDLSSDVQSKVMSGAGEFVKAGGTLAQCKTAMEAFQDFPWEDAEVPSQTAQPSATDKPTETASTQSTKGTSTTQTTSLQSTTDMTSTTQSASSTVTSSQTSSSGSETPTPTADLKREYVISSEDGTPWTSFKTLIDTLDGGEGFLARFDSIGSYMYVTMLNSTQAAEIADSHDWIEWVGLNEGGVPEEELEDFAEESRAFSVVQTKHVLLSEASKSLNAPYPANAYSMSALAHAPRAMGSPISNAPWWKKMLSAPPPGPDEVPLRPENYPDYLADDTGGAGTTIYVLDDGFDLATPDLLPNSRKVDHHIVPNMFTIPREIRDSGRGVDETIGGGTHGNMMASLAAGIDTGVSPKADLFLVKVKGQYKHSVGESRSTTQHSEASVRYWSRYVRDHISTRKAARQAGEPEVRSVINMSWGIKFSRFAPDSRANVQRILQRFLDFCKEQQTPVVVAAGNFPATLDVKENWPHALSKPDDSMIIVGGVNEDGLVIPEMIADSTGLVHVYAPGNNIRAPTDAVNWEPGAGTSQSAAITSGLIAYYNGLPNLQTFEAAPPGGVWGAKGLITSHAWPRSSPDSKVKVIYNLARGDPAHGELSCVQRRDKYGRRQDDGLCSLSSTFATSTSFSGTISASSASVSKASTAADSSRDVEPSATSDTFSTSNSSSTRIGHGSIASSTQLSTTSLESDGSSATQSLQSSATPSPTLAPTATAVDNCAMCRVELGKCFEKCDPFDNDCVDICNCLTKFSDEHCKLCNEITTCPPRPTSTAASTPTPTPLTPEEIKAACDSCQGAVNVCINSCGPSRFFCTKECKCTEKKNNPKCISGGGCDVECDD